MSKFMYTANGRTISNKQRIIESMANSDDKPAQKLPSDFFNLAGNLKLDGSVRATNFYKEDGTELQSVIKMGLPENVYYVDKKLGINQDKPIADLDVRGNARVTGELGIDGSMGLAGNFIGKGRVTAEDELFVGKNAGVAGNLGVGGAGTFAGKVTAEDELFVGKNAGIAGNLGVRGNIMSEGDLNANKVYTKGNIRIDNSTEQDKLMVFQNGDSKPPYLFYNKQGTMGVWNGDKAPWVLEGSGRFGSDAGSFYRAGDHSALQVKNGQNEGAYFWINDNNRDADGGKSTATVRNDAGHMRLQSKGGKGLTLQADTGSVVSDEDITASRHLNASGNANVSGDITFNGPNKWIIHTPDDDRRIMYMAPGNDKGEWMWDKQTQFFNNGNVQLSGGLMLGGQNIPHPDVGDGAFYRADGQVQIATDDLIRLRHVGSKSTGIQFDVREGPGDVNTPNGQMKITRQGIMFGGPNANREVNSAQISAGLHIPNSLNIVGMSADKGAASRKIDMWAEGGLNVYGDVIGNTGRLTLQNSGDWKDINLQGKCGQWHMSGPRCTENADFGIWYNPEPWSGKWQEQIRLSAKENKVKLPQNQQFCIGDICLTQEKLKELVIGSGTSNKMRDNMYFPEDAIIYQNVFDALKDKVIEKSGSPNGWNDGSYSQNPWNGRLLLHIGVKNAHPNGLLVRVPNGKNVIWLRALNDRWQSFEVYTKDGKQLGNFTTGWRKLSKYSPDGGLSDSFWNLHLWMPIRVPGPGEYIICGGNKKNDGGNDCWISGVAFSTNPWSHAMNSAVAYHWLVNEPADGRKNPTWNTQDWNNDQLVQLDQNNVYVLNVPVVKSGKDKLLYIIEHNNQWDGASHASVSVNGKPVERLRATYDNPFARHFNSKIYNRFIAAKVPNDLVTDSPFIEVTIDMRGMSQNIYFREIGTIDYI